MALPELTWYEDLRADDDVAADAIHVRQGQRYIQAWSVTARDGSAWVFTDAAFRMKVRPTARSVVVVLDASGFVAVDPDDAERAVLNLPPATTAALAPGAYEYDLFVDDVPVVAGAFVVTPGVSR